MVDQLNETTENLDAADAPVAPPAVEAEPAATEVAASWFRNVFDQFWTQAEPAQRNITLGVLGAMLLGIGFLVYASLTAPTWHTLVRGMAPEDQQAAINALQAKSIQYKLAPTGTILVPEESVHQARIEVA
ncbi:MAG: hypothetical protein QF464_04545, partial [Myxococcota bacterium]|nr:hypothetical protein [Myxococcota bacterium]